MAGQPDPQGEHPVAADHAAVDAAAILRQARRLRFQARPELVSLLAGAYHAARPGTGLTFAELRPYEPGDDTRHIDWNVTARQQRPYVRRFTEERSLVLWLIVDVSASMRFGPAGQTKSERAAQATALLAAAAIQNGDQAALTLVSDRVEDQIAPGTGVRHLSHLLRLLVAAPGDARGTLLDVALSRPVRHRRRGLVVLISDFLILPTSAGWGRLTRRNELLALRVVEPREERLPAAALVKLREVETGRKRLADAGSRRVRAAYLNAARVRQQAFQTWCAQTRAFGYDLPTESEPIRPLMGILRERAGRRFHP